MYDVIYFILFLLFNTIVWAHIIGTYYWCNRQFKLPYYKVMDTLTIILKRDLTFY